MTKLEIVRPYLEKFPDHGDMTLAKLIYNKHSVAFIDLENCRNAVRRARGHRGKDYVKDKSLFKPITNNTNPYKLPDSEEKIREPFVLPKGCNNILLISDLHIPYHSIDAITAALNYAKKEAINTIVINGDLIDFYGCSRFEKDPRKRSVKFEFDSTKAFLVALRHTFPNAKIYWLKGNHDVRYEHYLMAKAPEIFDDPYFTMEERLRLNEERIHVIGDKVLMKAGKLFIHHGHLFFRGFIAPVNSARGLFLRAKQSMICGHVHKISEHTETNLNGELITCWSTGSLCELSPDYAPYATNYAHGFAHIRTEDNGNYSVNNYRIYKGKIL